MKTFNERLEDFREKLEKQCQARSPGTEVILQTITDRQHYRIIIQAGTHGYNDQSFAIRFPVVNTPGQVGRIQIQEEISVYA